MSTNIDTYLAAFEAADAALYGWTPGRSGYGEVYLARQLALKNLQDAIAIEKADADHTHPEDGGTAIITRGGDSARQAVGNSLHIHDDGAVERVEDGAVVADLDTVAAREIYADRLSLALLGRRTVYSEYVDDATVKLTAGQVEINGTLYSLAADTNHTVTSTGPAWAYLMAAEPASGYALSGTEITDTTTAPTWDAAKQGWYSADGAKRCIGVVRVSATGVSPYIEQAGIFAFYDGNRGIEFINTTSTLTSATAVNVDCPELGRVNVLIGWYARNDSGTAESSTTLYVGPGDSASLTNKAHCVAVVITDNNNTNTRAEGQGQVMTDASGNVKYYVGIAGTEVAGSLQGFDLPRGF